MKPTVPKPIKKKICVVIFALDSDRPWLRRSQAKLCASSILRTNPGVRIQLILNSAKPCYLIPRRDVTEKLVVAPTPTAPWPRENWLDNPPFVGYNLTMTQLALQIPDDLKPFIDRLVKSGLFSDAAYYLGNLLYDVKAESETTSEKEVARKLARLRSEIKIGVHQLPNGESAEFDAEDIIQRGNARLAAKAQLHE